jgi:hypothetical protein
MPQNMMLRASTSGLISDSGVVGRRAAQKDM